MEIPHRLNELRESGKITWSDQERAWIAQPDEVVYALADEGFEEYKHEVASSPRGRDPAGGLWQGLNTRTGSVASAIWVTRSDPDHALVFIEVDGLPLAGPH
jgi:hypothetical protein